MRGAGKELVAAKVISALSPLTTSSNRQGMHRRSGGLNEEDDVFQQATFPSVLRLVGFRIAPADTIATCRCDPASAHELVAGAREQHDSF